MSQPKRKKKISDIILCLAATLNAEPSIGNSKCIQRSYLQLFNNFLTDETTLSNGKMGIGKSYAKKKKKKKRFTWCWGKDRRLWCSRAPNRM